jgi:multidrug efflux pump subunit AcrA (membrane-fusion protein)
MLPSHSVIKSGLYGSALLPGETRSVLMIPAHAVVERGQLKSVLVVEDGVAKRRLVTLGETDGDRVEILSGLAQGESVVLNPSSIPDAAAVRVAGGPQ